MTKPTAFDYTAVGRLAAINGRLAVITVKRGEMQPLEVEFLIRKEIETKEIGAYVGAVGKVRLVDGKFCGVAPNLVRLGAPKAAA